jgi:hypothetical protein
MQVGRTASPVENFTINFDQSGSSCKLNMSWENTLASVDITQKK